MTSSSPLPQGERIPMWERRCGDPTCSRRGPQTVRISLCLAVTAETHGLWLYGALPHHPIFWLPSCPRAKTPAWPLACSAL
ncbi:hypothetical protein C1X64_30690 [Pseudomonas sp. GW456-E7]|nr:hypothetical protein C1X64_30690 [Pseudomonas sp. GW456-E7]